MNKLIDFIFRIRFLTQPFIRFFVFLDNLAYKMLSRLVQIENHGDHPKHRILNYQAFFMDLIQPGERVIDIGCGDGGTAYAVASRAATVTAIDYNAQNIATAQKKYRHPKITYIVADATTYPFAERFDKIILSNVLEHITEREAFLKKLHSLAAVMLLRVPMVDRDWLTIYKKEKGLEYRLNRDHKIEYTLPVLTAELQKADWYIKDHAIRFGECWAVVTTDQAAQH